MNKRYLGALLMSPFLIFIFLGGKYLFFLVLLISIAGIFEFYRVIRQGDIKPISSFGYLLCLVHYTILYYDKTMTTSVLISIFALLLLLCVPILNIKYNVMDVAVTFLGYFYVAVFFSFIPLINSKAFGDYLIWLVFISSWSCDTAAYYVGRYFGKNKLCPKVSPKKTIEGSIGGLLGSGIICLIYGIIISYRIDIMNIWNYFIIGILCGIFCQFGDLVASSVKRFVGVKDYSNLIPGHGGILDRFDSIIFSSVIVYYYITFLVGI
jgi:phosphatidate cytidylyltransferase